MILFCLLVDNRRRWVTKDPDLGIPCSSFLTPLPANKFQSADSEDLRVSLWRNMPSFSLSEPFSVDDIDPWERFELASHSR